MAALSNITGSSIPSFYHARAELSMALNLKRVAQRPIFLNGSEITSTVRNDRGSEQGKTSSDFGRRNEGRGYRNGDRPGGGGVCDGQHYTDWHIGNG
jgi:hypothetical protein